MDAPGAAPEPAAPRVAGSTEEAERALVALGLPAAEARELVAGLVVLGGRLNRTVALSVDPPGGRARYWVWGVGPDEDAFRVWTEPLDESPA